MANKHYYLDDEFEININFKVKLHQISNYFKLDETELKDAVEQIKEHLATEIKSNITKEYIFDDETFGDFDSFVYSIK